jgi:hypothetical protein
MQKNLINFSVLILLLIFICFLLTSCSQCNYIKANDINKLKKIKNVSFEITTIEGKTYFTKEFIMNSDTLIFMNYSTQLGHKNYEIKLALNSIKTIKYCEFNTKQAFVKGLKFFSIVLLFITLYFWGPLHVGTIGG